MMRIIIILNALIIPNYSLQKDELPKCGAHYDAPSIWEIEAEESEVQDQQHYLCLSQINRSI